MGIPKFARFLMTRYPLILRKIRDERDVPEIDHLYLDINGIIHNVSHNNDLLTACNVKSSEQVYSDVCAIIDSILKLIRPKRLLMISADGVAPRAKMNQQRSRRFRKEELSPETIDLLLQQGFNPKDIFNSDCISAGTEFMYNLSIYMNNYIEDKKKTDTIWGDIQVLFTGSDVPGEGEHKILEYVRNYKSSNEYQNNTRHCIYGLDADLIMLSLITHEPNIVILREDSYLMRKKATDYSNKKNNQKQEFYEFILVSVLREYLELEFIDVKPKLKFDFNLERIIDDFIFFCFFIGNDFLPNLNTMDIETGALGNIFSFYKQSLPKLNDYITYHGKINFQNAKIIFKLLADQELMSLNDMLEEITEHCKESKLKKKHILNDKFNEIKRRKLNVKKGKFYEDLKAKTKEEKEKFKKSKKNKKINFLKEIYEKKKQIENPNKQFKFEEDVKEYLKQKEIFNNQAAEKQKVINETIVELFVSDEEDFKRKEAQKQKITDKSTTNEILMEGTKYGKYINDDNYCSDINFEDISDSDVSEVDSKEVMAQAVQSEEYMKATKDRVIDEENNVEDLNKVFQEKLISFYVTDVSKAKEFYYKEKLHIDITTKDGQQEQQKMFRKYLEGLQWVLYYYYRGIKSWKWFYPYHYAPMVSDFVDYQYDDDLEKVFENDTTTPFDPFLSLIFILPKKSFELLPECYRGIPEELKDLFPEKFQIDYNGKHTPWEAITLIPFLDENLISQVEKKHRKLTLEEEKRNSWGESYFYFENVKNVAPKKEQYAIYQKNNVLLDSNYIGKPIDCSFPTLKSIPFDFSSDSTKMYYGKNFKRVDRILIHPQLRLKNINENIIEKCLFSRNLFVNYPYKSFAKINGIVFKKHFYYIFENKMFIDPNFNLFTELTEKISTSMYKKGLQITKQDLLVNVSLFKGFSEKKNGKIIREYDEENPFYVPFEVTSLNAITNDFNEYKKHYHYTMNLEKIESSGINYTNNPGKPVIKESTNDNNNNKSSITSNSNGQSIYQSNNYNKFGNEEKINSNYNTKKIITKNNFTIDKKFKTYPEGIEIERENKISFDKNQVNVSEYRQGRIFQNENLKPNQLYFYSSDIKPPESIVKNENIIFKHI